MFSVCLTKRPQVRIAATNQQHLPWHRARIPHLLISRITRINLREFWPVVLRRLAWTAPNFRNRPVSTATMTVREHESRLDRLDDTLAPCADTGRMTTATLFKPCNVSSALLTCAPLELLGRAPQAALAHGVVELTLSRALLNRHLYHPALPPCSRRLYTRRISSGCNEMAFSLDKMPLDLLNQLTV